MLFKQNHCPAIQGIMLTSLLALLAGCGNSEALEGFVSADPKLKEDRTEQSGQTNQLTTALAEEESASEEDSNITSQPTPRVNNSTPNTIENEDELLLDAESFPLYPQAQIKEQKIDREQNSGTLILNTSDNRQAVADYYRAELPANGWEIVKPFPANLQQEIVRAIAIKDQIRLDLTLDSSVAESQSPRQNTQLFLAYQPVSADADTDISQAVKPRKLTPSAADRPDAQPDAQNNQSSPKIQDELAPKSTESESTSISQENNYFDSSLADFADLDEVPEQLQQPLQSVATLGILTPYTGKANVEVSKFAPNEIITRGEYARWLVAANNRYYSDNPGKKIYVAAKTTEPAFKDVNPSHPDFAPIQSLAEAGLIPSRLTEDNDNLLFRPDAPLIREDLVTWKVPLDTRQSLPKASIEAIEESWGFQDAADIDSEAIRALYADYQNGDRSNIRRIFGYTILFQPKKPVTRAEAAASLWYFGFQGDGITAREVLEAEAETES